MFEASSNHINTGTELAAYSWRGLRDLKPKSIEIPIMSCWSYPDIYYEYVRDKNNGVYNLPPVPKEAFSGDEELKREFLKRVEKKYGKADFIEVDDKLIPNVKPDIIFGNFGVVEEHGLHLPLDSDNIRIYGLIDWLYFGNTLVVPSLSYGITGPYEYDFPGTINLESEILGKMARNYIGEISGAFPDSRILFLTAHGGPDHLETIENAVKDSGKSNILFRFDFRLLDENKFHIRGHSSRNETSVIMFYRPYMVNLKNAKGGRVDRDYYDRRGYMGHVNIRNRSGVNGCGENHPKLSTQEFGREYVKAMVEEIEKLMETAY